MIRRLGLADSSQKSDDDSAVWHDGGLFANHDAATESEQSHFTGPDRWGESRWSKMWRLARETWSPGSLPDASAAGLLPATPDSLERLDALLKSFAVFVIEPTGLEWQPPDGFGNLVASSL
jgi:hypothetical protein